MNIFPAVVRVPRIIKNHANLLLGANPGCFVTFKKIPNASIKMDNPSPNIVSCCFKINKRLAQLLIFLWFVDFPKYHLVYFLWHRVQFLHALSIALIVRRDDHFLL